jgi:hypothetical protein
MRQFFLFATLAYFFTKNFTQALPFITGPAKSERCYGLNIGTKPNLWDVVKNGRVNEFWSPESKSSYYTENSQEIDYLYFSSTVVKPENGDLVNLLDMPIKYTINETLEFNPVLHKDSTNDYSMEIIYGCESMFNTGIIKIIFQMEFPECTLKIKFKKECLTGNPFTLIQI